MKMMKMMKMIKMMKLMKLIYWLVCYSLSEKCTHSGLIYIEAVYNPVPSIAKTIDVAKNIFNIPDVDSVKFFRLVHIFLSFLVLKINHGLFGVEF